MLRFSPRVLGAVFGFWLIGARADAAELRLPPITGDLEGVLTQFSLPGAPPLKWTFVAKPASDGLRDCLITVESKGNFLKVSAHVAGNGAGTWKIEEGRVEVGPWFALLAPQFAPALAKVIAEGTVTLRGGGALRQGRPEGKINVELSGGALRAAEQGWALEGITLLGEFTFDADGPHWASAAPLELAVKTISTTRFGARNLSLRASLDERRIVALLDAKIEMAGGEVTLAPTSIPLSPPDVKLKLKISRIGLQDIVALLPAGLAEARGRIEGELSLGWNEAEGFQLGAGHLALRDDEPTIVRLQPNPGFLTKSVPERIALLPASAGALARWLSPKNPAYADVSAIELGKTDLRVEALSVEMTPEGDSRGRSASVHVTARPVQKNSTVGLVTFEVNVAGPLSAVLKIGMQQGVSLDLH